MKKSLAQRAITEAAFRPNRWAAIWFAGAAPEVFQVMTYKEDEDSGLIWCWFRTADRLPLDSGMSDLLGHPGKFDNTNLRPSHFFNTKEEAVESIKRSAERRIALIKAAVEVLCG